MPKSEVEIKIDKATNENNVGEDWGLIFDIVDQINHSNSKKEIIKIFIKKLNDKDPHVIEHTLTLLNACVTNCDRNFKLEVCSRVFTEELKAFIVKKRFEKLSKNLLKMIENWTKESDFKNDPALNLIPTLYNELKRQGVEFVAEPPVSGSNKNMKLEQLDRKEEEELERAIQLSLKESQSSSVISKAKTPNNSQSSLFGQLMQNTQAISDNFSSTGSAAATTATTSAQSNKKRKVKALYDFEAAEDNEITFKAGDVLFVSDESDQNWWKGFNLNGDEGLFPSNFVTYDLDFSVEIFDSKSKKVTFNDDVNVNLISTEVQQGGGGGAHLIRKKIVIDEKKIDECIEMLQNADPTGEIQPDSQELLDLEEECYMMGPLIDRKLQDIDQQHSTLEDLNLKILDAFQLYNNLMKESITKTSALINTVNPTQMLGQLNGAGGNGTMVATNGSINYAAAPPSLEANSLHFANKLNSLAAMGTAAGNSSNTNPALAQLQNNSFYNNNNNSSNPAVGASQMVNMPPSQMLQNGNGVGYASNNYNNQSNQHQSLPSLGPMASLNQMPQQQQQTTVYPNGNLYLNQSGMVMPELALNNNSLQQQQQPLQQQQQQPAFSSLNYSNSFVN